MRKATLHTLKWNVVTKEYDYTVVGPVIFHQFGCEYEEFESGPGNYAVAIIEHPDGRIENVITNRIQFVDPTVIE